MYKMQPASYPNKRSNVVSELRDMKPAAIMFYANSEDIAKEWMLLPEGEAVDPFVKKHLAQYIDNPTKVDKTWLLDIASGKPHWFVGRDISDKGKDIRDKIVGKAETTHVLAEQDPTKLCSSGDKIWLLARPEQKR